MTGLLGSNLIAATRVIEPIRFTYHSNFWMNLHHRLYREAMAISFVRNGEKLIGRQRNLYADSQRFSASQAASWTPAINVYLKHYVSKDLLFDDDLSNIKTILASTDHLEDVAPPSGLPKNLSSALRAAAPIYHSTFWGEDDLSNKIWISSAKKLVSRFGDPLSNRLAGLYRARYPKGPYRVDVVRDANYFDAYTTDYPFVHIVVSSAALSNGGRASLETLYHEASHSIVFPDSGTVGDAILRDSKFRRHAPPDELWHAIIFYTTGYACQEAYAAAGENPYVMFADQVGLFKNSWPTYKEPLQHYWKDYLKGNDSFDRAIRKTVDAALMTKP